jgi:prepilin-type processing-associated H-X9-DG protein
MRSQRFKDAVFASASPLTMLSHGVWKLRLGRSIPSRLRKGSDERVWINLGSGASPYPQFVNVDINLARHPDMWLDVRHGMPFAAGTVDAIYTRHVLEHFYHDELTRVLAECRRVLRPQGGIRILVPSLEVACRAYLDGDDSVLMTFPRPYRSRGGRAVNLLFCDGQHRMGFDFSLMQELLQDVGFTDIQRVSRGESQFFPAAVLSQTEPDEGWINTSLIVEARR